MSVRFYFVRHGQTLFNVERRIQGACDSPLTEKGWEDARRASLALRGVSFDRAFCSSSERAYDTACEIVKRHNVKLVPMKELKEFDFGKYDGEVIFNIAEIAQVKQESCDWSDVGGENLEIFAHRLQRAFARMLAVCRDGDRVLLVGHGTFAILMIHLLLEKDLEKWEEENGKDDFPVPNGSIMVFEYDGEKGRLISAPCVPESFRDSSLT